MSVERAGRVEENDLLCMARVIYTARMSDERRSGPECGRFRKALRVETGAATKAGAARDGRPYRAFHSSQWRQFRRDKFREVVTDNAEFLGERGVEGVR